MSMSASTLPCFLTTWGGLPKLSVRSAEPLQEGRWTRILRWLADRQHLREVDSRLLRDVGPTREDVLRGVPFRGTACRPKARACPSALIRLGTLQARDWQLKLYAPAAGLRPEDLAAARRAFRAVLAEPCPEPVSGFAILAIIQDDHLPVGSLALTACRWDGELLRRSTLLIPVAGAPVHRIPDHGLGLGELQLAARECRAWQRHGARTSPPALAAYLAEDCA
ncbi:MAG TPA: hypothetical protein VNZ61_16380 [Roseomonas sp.]|nr:hypothetical protein [Roseomonas sp.]